MIEKIQMFGDTPLCRFGHTMTYMNQKTIILFGGATGDTGKYNITGDVYQCDIILKQWKRINPQGVPPQNRAAHAAAAIDNNNKMVIFGGAIGGGGMADDNLYLLDLSQGQDKEQWITIPVYGSTPGRRYGHTMIFVKPFIVVYGGNTGTESVSDAWVLNIEKAPYSWQKLDCQGDSPVVRVYHSAALCSSGAANGMMVVFGGRTQDQSALNDSWGLRKHRDGRWDWVKAPYKINSELPIHRYQVIRLAQEAVVGVAYDPNSETDNLTKKVSIQKLQKQGIKLNANSRYGTDIQGIASKKLYYESIYQIFLDNLLLPNQYENSTQKDYLSYIKKENIIKLCDEVQKIFEKEPMVLRLRCPIKIFGNLNGQYEDLMRFFNHFGSPCDNQQNDEDIDFNDYLFLGNYLGRGTMQIETILLLFALKLKYFDQIFMLRGNMEDKKINKATGFADECALKFQEDQNDPYSVFQRINKVFEYMPIACVLEDSIFCVHSGIGSTLRIIDEIEGIPRPFEIIQDPKTYQHKIALELLWSDPNLDENVVENIPNNEHDIFNTKNVIRFGQGRIRKFMQDNGVCMIIRSNEPVMKGIQKSNNNVITLFSNTNYAGKFQNNAAILQIGKQRKIQPKLIQCNINFNSSQAWFDLELMLEQKNQMKYNLVDQEEVIIRKKQATPPRDINQ
ncbi:ser thr protein phosphatase family protein, putative [Ichthyophthirius multifiliis]|uniref:Ser thr protein phosphatase family protein, putative n=1 Tax=Ichthyophthirius multifiliis TaxID=5932 RepID=G0R663_ICHMU|nr:ser thr protein phosphatase family protein, putative [Ichthyophthirius multifiliis]EGR27027.1 ser thr protein phosphatase family protein, putative [Ichthyophthirius multifiliis]|eukprot:XP_004023911.1 ser thr protein phosphatase family protein, putative [Ichthyophthirius multifiliis]